MDGNFGIIAIGSDHAGVFMKAGLIEHLGNLGYQFTDFGTNTDASMDYPDTAHPLAKAVDSGEFRFGILLCGSGNGVAIVANKYRNVRAAICWKKELAELARQHNDANIMVLPARFISQEEAVEFATAFLAAGFEGGRHQKRVDKISKTL
jgi:ribose 5-phosphate isomerase B